MCVCYLLWFCCLCVDLLERSLHSHALLVCLQTLADLCVACCVLGHLDCMNMRSTLCHSTTNSLIHTPTYTAHAQEPQSGRHLHQEFAALSHQPSHSHSLASLLTRAAHAQEPGSGRHLHQELPAVPRQQQRHEHGPPCSSRQ